MLRVFVRYCAKINRRGQAARRGFVRQSTSWVIAWTAAAAIIFGAIAYFNREAQETARLDLERDAIAAANKGQDESGPIVAIIKPTRLNQEKIKLGRALFHDQRLSKDNSISCAFCHDLARGGVDGLARSIGVDGKTGDINSPTIYNVSLMSAQFWDGRARDLEEQVDGPIANPLEMATSWDEILIKLNLDDELVEQFEDIYASPPNRANAINAIVEFEKSLITPSRFDRWLLGDDSAITADELKGYNIFVESGCAACHQGAAIGGNMFQLFGVARNYYDGSRKTEKSDFGRYNVTGREEDRYVFKVPTLRNVELTAPYFHDASVDTLYEAVNRMGSYQLGVDLDEEDARQITLFLRALTGDELR
ncbi:MAG: cytochrome-c peroxidase [Helicobacteraceae bacterium]|jgi:cytochrome c peroxidase|nr:cytochrome-c peroxidase [Helicobacteraceae bacterium]